MSDWTDTRLWKCLEDSRSPEAEDVRALLRLRMPEIQTVIDSGGTAPADFTLHDAGHSFRVAERMAEIISPELLGKLCTYELALLLLAAYLHDIGMTPEQGRVRRHWRHLLFGPGKPGSVEALSPREATELQVWLDQEKPKVAVPLASAGRAGERELNIAAELLTRYARYRHNDWSEEWIRAHLSRDRMGRYQRWLEDLVRLCRSHHEGHEELIASPFDPWLVSEEKIVHLRYLACVLRIADILDVDPERTPAVLFEHRAIAPGSVPYWWKDQDLSIYRDGVRLIVYGRPRNSVVEKAIEVTATEINTELNLCVRIGREKPFSNSFFSSDPLPHGWSYAEYVVPQILPPADSTVERAPQPRAEEPDAGTASPVPPAVGLTPHLRLAVVILAVLIPIAIGAAALRLSRPDPNEQLELSVAVHEPGGALLSNLPPSCSLCGAPAVFLKGHWRFTFARSRLPADDTVTVTAEDVIGFARGRKEAHFGRQRSLSLRLDLARHCAVPRRRVRFEFDPQVDWLTSAAWTPDGYGLILVGLLDEPPTIARLYSLQGRFLTRIAGPASYIQKTSDRAAPFLVKVDTAQFRRLDRRFNYIDFPLQTTLSEDGLLRLYQAHDWVPVGRDLVILGDVAAGLDLEWKSWLLKIPPQRSQGFERIEEINAGKSTPFVYLMGYPHLASLGDATYFLRMHKPPQTNDKAAAPAPAILADLPWGRRNFNLDFEEFQAVPDLPQEWESGYGLFESSSMVAAVYSWKGYIYTLLKCGTVEGEETRWFLTKMDPQEMVRLHTISVPATTPHLTLVPGDPLWAIIERKGFIRRGNQPATHLTLVPAAEIESADSVHVIRGPQPQCLDGANWDANELRWIKHGPGT